MFWRIPNLLGDSPVEFILDKESFTLEELLDEEEIIQECKALNTRLINFLRDRAQLEQLLQYIIEDAPEDADSKRAFKFPFIACEILTCEVDVILKSLVEDEDLMNKLFSFLEPDRVHNSTLAGYFSKVVACLMLRKTTLLMTYVQTHEAIFHHLVDLIGITSIMEILLRLVGADDHTYPNHMDIMQWLADTKLLEIIVDKLSPAHSAEVNANAAEVLMAIIRNTSSALAAKLSSQSFVARIFWHALENSSSKSALVHSLSVCIAFLDPKRSASPASVQYVRSQHLYESFSHVDPETLHAMLTHLDDLLKLLNVSSDAKTLPTTYGELHPPFGKHRLKAVEFIVVLLEAGGEVAEKELIRSGAIDIILDLFFKYPFNNSLHHLVEKLVMLCLASKNIAIVDHLFCDCGIISKFLQADRNPFLSRDSNVESVPTIGRQPFRAGNIGHITRISNKLVQLANNNDHIRSYLQESEEWIDWQTNVLRERNAVENVFHWACGRPTTLQERTRDSDEDELHDRDYDIRALVNNTNHAFRYHVYENDNADEDVYIDQGSSGLVISTMKHGVDNQSLFTNCDWFAFEDESALETLDRMDDINLNETSSGGNSNDDEVVVGVEEPTKIVLPEDKYVNPFQFEIAENVDLFNDQQQPEWVGWREASDIQVDEPTDFSTQSNSRETAASTSVSTIGVLAGGRASTVSESGELAKVEETAHCSFEEDAEFVGADIEVGRAMEDEVTAPKRNFLLKVPDLLEPREDETAILEFKSHWRIEPEVGVVQE
ncbi:serine threonine-protein phosphatase 6 regulatory subunit [Musa troglodytarum]|uniref:Serine threonine-protein phosphatase 6 regulatory subunit n=1 Tax=Musa troglodytarum TaxID=320322 RepID=A0A9E7EZR9_9LILI|nr:serine threonine-protein phosphatase 6 regulatory subunit [Musa troglodytarum]